MVGEVLPPEPWREGSLVPFAVRVWYSVETQRHLVTFEDGGVWALPDSKLLAIDPSDVKANVGEIFARWPGQFTFVGRNIPGKYGRRT
jgi:hypothetical protein